jgi:hypothetical protein
MEWLKVGEEEGGEGGVSNTLLCGGLEVPSPSDTMSGVVIGYSETPGGDFCAHAG